ncbi:cell division peptidoglycan polymerase FtsW [Streptococcus fryi]
MKINKRHFINYSILLPYLILSVFGLIMVYSTTSPILVQAGANPFASVILQGVFWVVSLIAIAFLYHIRLDFLKSPGLLGVVMLVEIIMLLAARFIFDARNGAHGWISFGPITFQPAEYLKVIIIWLLAYTFSRRQTDIEHYDYQAIFRGTLLPRQFGDWRVYAALMTGLVVIMPDLGNAVIVTLTGIIVYLVSGVGYRWFTVVFLGIVGSSAAFLGSISLIGFDNFSTLPLFAHIAKRFKAYFDPFGDRLNDGLQMSHSYYAMSNGGWFGLGLGNSIEKQGYLPEAQTDFVFSIVIEEFGLIGAGLILALVFFLILRILLVGIKARNPFNSIMALGIGGMFLVQVFVNIGGMSGLIPSTGVTFPFLSQGGNSLLIISVAVGIVLNIDANESRSLLYKEVDQML